MQKSDILRKLRQTEDYISGQDLCDELGVSRTAVWKAVKQLKSEGYEIDSVTNRGYRLVGTPDIISEDLILSALDTGHIGRSLICCDRIDSTNEGLKRLYVEKGGLADGTVMTAHRQTGGKGRRGRSWDDGDGENIAFSILLTPDMDPGRASMLTIVAAMAVADAINGVLAREKEDLRCGIKWPNDIIMDRKKVCGILTEMSAEPDHIDYVIIGIGINVNASSFPEELRDRATSILLQSGVRTDRSALISAVLNRFELRYGRFLETLDLSGLKEEYEGRLTGLGKKVRVLDPCGEFEGICRGIDEAGALLVETPENGLRRITSGEVSVRGIYGYV